MFYEAVVCGVAMGAITMVLMASNDVGMKIQRLSNIPPPWNGWMEETIYHEINTDPSVSIWVGVGMLLCVFRTLKYLTIFPMLGVPVASIFKS